MIRVTLTTIGGTDLHILKGEYAVRPGGKERMRRLMELVRYRGLDLAPMLTHTFSLDEIVKAYHFFGERRDGVIKLAIKP